MSTFSTAIDARTLERQGRRDGFDGAVAGTPGLLLRLEGAAAMAAAIAAYARFGEGWLMFGLLFLAPDLSMLGYRVGRRVGAAIYNVGHSYLTPAVLATLGLGTAQPVLIGLALIWVAHIGFDRLLGYGLKYGSTFGHTHLGARGGAVA